MHDIEDYGAEVSVWGAIPFSGIIEQDKFLMLCMILKIMGQKWVGWHSLLWNHCARQIPNIMHDIENYGAEVSV